MNILQDHREQLVENKEQKLTLSAAHEKRYDLWHYKALSSAQYYSVSVSMTSSWSNINFDEKLKLEKHRQSLSNGIKKLNALARLVSCMIIAKWRSLMNAFFFKLLFSCTHWYGLAVIDKYPIKIDLLHNSVSIHYQNFLQSAIEMIKTLKGAITEFIKGIFKLKTKCLTIK